MGLVSGIATISAGVTQSNIDRLVTGLLVVISGGFVATGGLWLARRRTEATLYPRLPAMTLVLFGISCIIGAIVSFSPVRSTVNQGLQMLLMGGLILTGVVLVFSGWRWYQERQMRYPLSILSGALVLGLAYITRQRLGILDSAPVGLLVVLVAVLIAVAIAFVGPSESDPV